VGISSRQRGRLSTILSAMIQRKKRLQVKSKYSESSDEEELKEAYKILYIKFMKLRETSQQNMLELDDLKTEKKHVAQENQEL